MTSIKPTYEELEQRVRELSSALLESRRLEAEQGAARHECRTIVDNIPGITYRCLNDPDYTTVFIGGRIPAFCGQSAPALLAKARVAFARVIHPDDLPLVRETINRQVAEGGVFDLDYRVVLDDGEICWVNDRGCMVPGSDGRTACLDGMLVDVSERKRIEQALRESEAQFRVLVNHSHDLIWLVRPDGCLTFVSPSCEAVLGYLPALWVNKSFWPLIHPADVPACRQYLEQVLATQRGFSGPQFRVLHADGDWRWHEAAVQPVYSDDGELLSFVGISRDVHERICREEQILQMAYHDPLTGLANRPLFLNHLELGLARARRSATQVAVALLDLDRFKDVNDELGHDVGDHLLKAVARRLESLVRASDTVARFGGDEFLLILTDLEGVEDAVSLAAKIVSSFDEPVQVSGHEIAITTSMGLALYPTDAEDADLLVKRADKAMYHAKRSGRNRYSLFGQIEPDAALRSVPA